MSDEKPTKRKGFVGFYIGAGAFAILMLAAPFTWKPLRIRYYEWQVERKTPKRKQGAEVPPDQKCMRLQWALIAMAYKGDFSRYPAWREAKRLSEFGPEARPAFRRLLSSQNGAVRDLATLALAYEEATWALPMLVELAEDEDESVAWQAIITAELISTENFLPEYIVQTSPNRPPPPKIKPSLPNCRRRLLDWWEKEGEAKYGSGK